MSQNETMIAGKRKNVPLRGKNQNESRGYAMPTEGQQRGPMPDRGPTSGRGHALSRVVDEARGAALKGPNPEEHTANRSFSELGRVQAPRMVGNFDGKSRRVYNMDFSDDIISTSAGKR